MYNEDEKQQNEINRNNSDLIFKPKYIVFRPDLLNQWLSINEALVFSFIDGYLKNKDDKFYFTNEQIGNIFMFWEQAISNIIKRLKDKGFISTDYRLKANGWKVRFIRKLYSDYNLDYSPTITAVIDNNNKISNNKISINNTSIIYWAEAQNEQQPLNVLSPVGEQTPTPLTPRPRKREDIDELIAEIKAVCNEYGVAYDKTKDRMFAKHILDWKEIGTFCDNIGQSRMNFAVNVLIASIKINYFKGACSGPMKIYQNYAEVYNQTAMKHNKQNSLVWFLPWLNIW